MPTGDSGSGGEMAPQQTLDSQGAASETEIPPVEPEICEPEITLLFEGSCFKIYQDDLGHNWIVYLRPGYTASSWSRTEKRSILYRQYSEKILVDHARPENNWEAALVEMAIREVREATPLDCLWILRTTPWADLRGDGKLILIKRHAAVAETLGKLREWLGQRGVATDLPADNSVFTTFKGKLVASKWREIKDCPYAYVVPLF